MKQMRWEASGKGPECELSDMVIFKQLSDPLGKLDIGQPYLKDEFWRSNEVGSRRFRLLKDSVY
jgi:hypothetical protein